MSLNGRRGRRRGVPDAQHGLYHPVVDVVGQWGPQTRHLQQLAQRRRGNTALVGSQQHSLHRGAGTEPLRRVPPVVYNRISVGSDSSATVA